MNDGERDSNSEPGGLLAGEEASAIAVVALYDVKLGRGKGNQQHPGNMRYQAIVDQSKSRYFHATSRHEKVLIAHQVVRDVLEQGRFLKYDKDLQGWVEVGEVPARQKVCQALQYRKRNPGSGGLGRLDLDEPSQEGSEGIVEATTTAAASAAAVSAQFAQGNMGLEPLYANEASLSAPNWQAQAAVAFPAEPHSDNPHGDNWAAAPAVEPDANQALTPDSEYEALVRSLTEGQHFEEV